MLGRRTHHLSLGITLPLLVALLIALPTLPAGASETPPAELNYVCIDAQRNVIYASSPAACEGRETVRTLPEDRPARWCADHLGRLKESVGCKARDRQITVPDDGPVFVCARNIVGGTTQPRGSLRTVLDISQCDQDETGYVTPAAPEGVADLYTIDEDTLLVLPEKGVLDNDIDLTGAPLMAELVDTTSEGALEFEATGGFRFDPRGAFDSLDSGESATTTFRYIADDGALVSEPTTATIRVTGVNDRPHTADDVFVTDEDTTLQVSPAGVLVNDSDAEGHPLTSALLTEPAGGALTLDPDGGLRFAPGADFQHLGATPGETENVTFTYVARDGTTDSDATTVNLRVIGVNDAPIGAPDALETDENTAITVDPAALVANDSDAEGQALIATGVTLTGTGVGTLSPLPDGTLRYDPDADSDDPDGEPDLDHLAGGETATVRLSYQATDSAGLGSAPVTVTIVVHGLSAPTANDDVRSTDEDHAVTLDVFANDQVRDGTLDLDTSQTDGQVTVEHDGVVRYDPTGKFDQVAGGAASSDSFEYTLTNGEGSSTGTVSIQISGVNDAPVAHDDFKTVVPGTELKVPDPGVLANDKDIDNVLDLEAVLVSPPDRGRLTLHPKGGFTFDPSGDFPGGGSTTFSYRADDGMDESATATVTLQVSSNVPPTFESETFQFTAVVTDPAGSVVGRLRAHDDDDDPLGFVIVDADSTAFDLDPGSGELTIGADGPPTVGVYTLVVDVSDGRGGSDRTTVTVSVVPELNAIDDHYVAVGNTQLVGSAPVAAAPNSGQAVVNVAGVLANDGGSTGRVVPATDLGTLRGGSVDLAADGSFVYRPPAAAPGTEGAWDGVAPLTDSFSYQIEGEGVDDPTGDVTIELLDAVWYVDNHAAAGGSGTAWSPFSSLNSVSGSGTDPDLPGQVVFLFGHPDNIGTTDVESAYPGGIQLEDRQELVGHGVGLTVVDGGRHIPLITAGPTPRVDGPSDGAAIEVAEDNRLRGLAVGGEGDGITGSAVGDLHATVPALQTKGDPLRLAGDAAVDVRIDDVTSTGQGSTVALTGLGGSVSLGAVELCTSETENPCADDGTGGLSVMVSDSSGLVEIARAELGNAVLSVDGSAAAGQVVVGELSADGPDAGLAVRANLGTVSVADLDLVNVSGTGVLIADDDGTTTVGDGRVVGVPAADGPLLSIGGGSGGTIRIGADVTSGPAGGALCDAVLARGVAEGGTVELGGRVVSQGCGVRIDGVDEAVAGTVRFLGGMDVRTHDAAAFTAVGVPAPGRLEVLPSVAGSVLAATDHAVLVVDDVRVGAGGVRFNRADATFAAPPDAAATGIEISDVSGEAGPGLLVNGGTVTSPGRAGATLTGSSLVTLRGIRVDQSAGDGIVVADSRQITLDGLRVQQPDGIGLAASGTGDLVVDNSTIAAAGSYGIQVTDLAGRTTLRGSSVSDSRDTQLVVTDGSTVPGSTDEMIVQSTVFMGGEAENDSITVLAGQDEGSATAADLRFEVSGTTPAGSIGGDTGLAATTHEGAHLHVALSRFAVADTAGDAVAMHAEGIDSSLSFALNTINTSGGGGIQLAGGAGIRVDATYGAVAQGSMTEVAVLTTEQSGVVLDGVQNVALNLVQVQATTRHGIEITDSQDVTLDQVEVSRAAQHGLFAVGTSGLVVDDSRFDLRPPRPVPASTNPADMPRFSGIRIEQPSGTANAVTDTTLRGSTGDQLTVLDGVGAIRLAGLTVLDTAVDPVIGRTTSTPLPVPDGNAVSVLAGDGSELDVDLGGGSTTVDESILLQAKGDGHLTVTGGLKIEHVSSDSPEEREDSDPDATLVLEASDEGAVLAVDLAELQIVQAEPDPGTPRPGTALLVEARDESVITEFAVAGGTIDAADGPAVLVHTTFTEPPVTFPPAPTPGSGTINEAIVENLTISAGSGDALSVEDVNCLDLLGNDTTAVPGTGYVLDEVGLVDFTPPDVAAWLTAKGNLGPPVPRFVSVSDVFPGECS